MQWIRLFLSIGRGALGYSLSGALIFAVAGLAEATLIGGTLALLLVLLDKSLAVTVFVQATCMGTGAGFVGGAIAFFMAGLRDNTRATLKHADLLWRYVPRDAAFWNCLRSALWASAMLALSGAFTGAMLGIWWLSIQPPPTGPVPLNYALSRILVFAGSGAALGFSAGVFLGALTPPSVQIARRRIKEWRGAGIKAWESARLAAQR